MKSRKITVERRDPLVKITGWSGPYGDPKKVIRYVRRSQAETTATNMAKVMKFRGVTIHLD